jgi:hypothetical protein
MYTYVYTCTYTCTRVLQYSEFCNTTQVLQYDRLSAQTHSVAARPVFGRAVDQMARPQHVVLAVVFLAFAVGAARAATRKASNNPSGTGINATTANAAGAAAFAGGAGRKFTWDSHVPDRLQWNENTGYCGEVSLIIAALQLGGAYFSQYDARTFAAKPGARDVQEKHPFLVGENDQAASDAARLTYAEFDNSGSTDPKRYLAWIKKMVRAGSIAGTSRSPAVVVTCTVFMNYLLFYGDKDEGAGDPDYDHIVLAARVESDYDDDEYHADDLFTIADHGVWSPDPTAPPYYFTYAAGDFAATRRQANTNGHVYSLPDTSDGNFGIAHTGHVDAARECRPLSVQASVNSEEPEIKDKSEVRPAARPVTLSVTVTNLTVGEAYTLYVYDDETKVPESGFHAHAAAAIAAKNFTAAGDEWSEQENIVSSDKRFFRCVVAAAAAAAAGAEI